MRVEIDLLGRFEVRVEGVPVPAEEWRRRQAAALVKLLALAPRRTLHREQVIDSLWPGLTVEDAAARLHKAAHYARRSLGVPQALVLSGDHVQLCPDIAVIVDVEAFQRCAEWALAAEPKRLVGSGARRRPLDRVGCCPTTRTSRGSKSRANGWSSCTRPCYAAPAGGRSWPGPTRPTRRPVSRWPGSSPTPGTGAGRSGSWSGWSAPYVGSWA